MARAAGRADAITVAKPEHLPPLGPKTSDTGSAALNLHCANIKHKSVTFCKTKSSACFLVLWSFPRVTACFKFKRLQRQHRIKPKCWLPKCFPARAEEWKCLFPGQQVVPLSCSSSDPVCFLTCLLFPCAESHTSFFMGLTGPYCADCPCPQTLSKVHLSSPPPLSTPPKVAPAHQPTACTQAGQRHRLGLEWGSCGDMP